MANPKIKISFNLTDEFGNEFSMATSSEVYNDIDETNLDYLGRNFNTFLKQCGYYRENNYLFMPSVTEEEYEALDTFLKDLRSKKE